MSSILKVDTINEVTSANGVTVDGLSIKDSKLVTADSVVTTNITNSNITNAKLASGSFSNITGTGTLTSFRSTGIDDNADALAMTITSAENIGIGETTPLGKLHIKTGDSGQGTAQGEADELVIEGSANAGINILSGSTSLGMISFGDSGDANIGFIHYNHNNNAMTFRTNTSDTMIIDSSGAITKPLQPAVHAVPNAAQNDMATGIVKIVLGAEVYDINADFNVSNSTFTAPVTGKYMVTSNIDLSDIDTATQWLYGNLLITSNRNYYMNTTDPRKDFSADISRSFNGAAIVDMDANDTLTMNIRSSAHGAAQMNVVFGGGETSLQISLLQ
jgi:hypothetical protein